MEVSGIYQNDCFVNGTLETMEYNCNLEDCVVFLPLLVLAFASAEPSLSLRSLACTDLCVFNT